MTEHTIIENKHYDRGFISQINDLSQRVTQDPSIIANNRSYVGRANRVTPGQLRAYEYGMEQYGIAYDNTKILSQVCDTKASIKKYKDYEAIVLDIGFGAGHTLSHMAEQLPNELFIGIETFRPGIGAMFVRILPKKVDNIRCIHHDAVPSMFHMIEESSIDRIQIFFPDPWQKMRYKKRRLIQTRFLQLCQHLLTEDGILWIVSDWEDYAIHIFETLEKFSKENMPHNNSVYPLSASYFSHDKKLEKELESKRMISRFEKKGLQKNHKIYPFVYKKVLY